MKAVFLDKDDTLVDDNPCNVEPRCITLCSAAGPALRLLARLNYRLVVVGDQAAIAHGQVDEVAMASIADRLGDLMFRERVALDAFYYCPHHPKRSVTRYAFACGCRKPQPGLLLKAASEHQIDLRASWMVGARLHDVEAGNRAGCRTLLVDNGTETEWRLGPRRVPTRIAPDLYAAAMLIASEGDERR
ncbi:HAD family hydrolase [Massilia psychrophila]|jgi:D,D-heptose 1,7-bisphosphate phosphatase|uniref:D,D-heptose 1,7-bisphosphate phosphatase n=2 Tax=Massilia psychrophila TaxID=1603353 RepID=A0A2G8T3T2_9BURK|nr:HAD family hydrolase [Massilia psychrophila]